MPTANKGVDFRRLPEAAPAPYLPSLVGARISISGSGKRQNMHFHPPSRVTPPLSLLALLLAACGGPAEVDPAGATGSVTAGLHGESPSSSGITVSFQNDVFPDGGYNGTTDAYIRQASPNTNFGGSQTLRMDGTESSSDSRDTFTLIKWDDLDAHIPPGSTITDARLVFWVDDESNGDSYEVFQVLRPWDESLVTWNSPWQKPGANEVGVDRADVPLGALKPTSENTYHDVVLNSAGLAVVQEWVDDPTKNHGFIIRDPNENNGATVRSSEANGNTNNRQKRPRLQVTYTPPNQDVCTVSLNAVKDSKMKSAEPNKNFGSDQRLEVDGSDPSGGDIISLLQWDLSSIPSAAAINWVSLTVFVLDQTNSDQSYEVFGLKRAWVENEVTWNRASTGNNWEKAGATGETDHFNEVAALFTPTQENTFYTTVFNQAGEDLVKAWVSDPTKNHGIIIADLNNNNGADFRSRETTTPPSLTVEYVKPLGHSCPQ